jgi:hypothetical protein
MQMPNWGPRFGPYGLFISALLGVAGCDSEVESAGEVARAPTKAGEVWELDGSAGRERSPAAMLAYVNGLHVLVLDGNEAFAGMTRLRAEKGPDGHKTFRLADGLTAELAPAGDAMELRFSTGESISMRRRDAR